MILVAGIAFIALVAIAAVLTLWIVAGWGERTADQLAVDQADAVNYDAISAGMLRRRLSRED